MGFETHQLSVLGICLALAACGPSGSRGAGGRNVSGAPAGAGLCWRSVQHAGKLTFSVLSHGDGNLETCAMHLEVVRRMHDWPAVSGAYEGQYLYADRADIVTTADLRSHGYSVLTAAQRQDLEDQITTLLAAQPPAKDK